MTLLAIAAMSLIPYQAAVEDHTDLAEVNHYYNGEGKLVFVQ